MTGFKFSTFFFLLIRPIIDDAIFSTFDEKREAVLKFRGA